MRFRGHVRDLPLAAMLDVLFEQGSSHDVRLSDGAAEGVLVVREGALVHAELAGQRGLTAFRTACASEELVYEVTGPAHAGARTIAAGHAQLAAIAAGSSERVSHADVEDARVSEVLAERARASRSLGALALGVALAVAASLVLLRQAAHAHDRGAPAHASLVQHSR